jgi:hypothetical protein
MMTPDWTMIGFSTEDEAIFGYLLIDVRHNHPANEILIGVDEKACLER